MPTTLYTIKFCLYSPILIWTLCCPLSCPALSPVSGGCFGNLILPKLKNVAYTIKVYHDELHSSGRPFLALLAFESCIKMELFRQAFTTVKCIWNTHGFRGLQMQMPWVSWLRRRTKSLSELHTGPGFRPMLQSDNWTSRSYQELLEEKRYIF